MTNETSLRLRGTAFAGIRLTKPGKHRIRVTAENGVELQVTLIPVQEPTAVVTAVQNGSEIVVTLMGKNIQRLVELSLEDHSQSKSKIRHIHHEKIVVEPATAENTIIARCIGGAMPDGQTVKVVYETHNGMRCCVSADVTLNVKVRTDLVVR